MKVHNKWKFTCHLNLCHAHSHLKWIILRHVWWEFPGGGGMRWNSIPTRRFSFTNKHWLIGLDLFRWDFIKEDFVFLTSYSSDMIYLIYLCLIYEICDIVFGIYDLHLIFSPAGEVCHLRVRKRSVKFTMWIVVHSFPFELWWIVVQSLQCEQRVIESNVMRQMLD